MRGSISKTLLITAVVLVLVVSLLEIVGLNPFSGIWDQYKQEVLSTQVVEIAERLATSTKSPGAEEVQPSSTVTPTPTFTPQPTHTPTAIPLVEPQFVINGQVFVDLCAELEERGVEHICPLADRVNVPLDGYFIAFEDYDLEKGLYFEDGVSYFCPEGETCSDGFVIMDREAPTYRYEGPVEPGDASYLNERYLLFYVPSADMGRIQDHYDFANLPGIDPNLMINFNKVFKIRVYISQDVMRTMAETGVQVMYYNFLIDCGSAPPGAPGCDD